VKKESENMQFTGERFVPEVRGDIELEHLPDTCKPVKLLLVSCLNKFTMKD
jgi:hypothetical protein